MRQEPRGTAAERSARVSAKELLIEAWAARVMGGCTRAQVVKPPRVCVYLWAETPA